MPIPRFLSLAKATAPQKAAPHKKVIIPPSMCCNPRFCLSMLILGSLFCHFLFCRKWTSNFITIRQITPFLRQMVAVFLVVVSCCGILGLNRAQLSASPRKLSWRAPCFGHIVSRVFSGTGFRGMEVRFTTYIRGIYCLTSL